MAKVPSIRIGDLFTDGRLSSMGDLALHYQPNASRGDLYLFLRTSQKASRSEGKTTKYGFSTSHRTPLKNADIREAEDRRFQRSRRF
jgi:hypothetical protein